jgi:hypothetical protein
MAKFGRIGIIITLSLLTYALALLAGAPRWLALAAGLIIAGLLWRATRGPPSAREARAFRWGGIAGSLGFAGGYIGPLYLSDSNLGPLLGIFITGPAGLCLGAALGALWPPKPTQNQN